MLGSDGLRNDAKVLMLRVTLLLYVVRLGTLLREVPETIAALA